MPRKKGRKTRRGGQKVRSDRLDRTRVSIPRTESNCSACVFYIIGYTDLKTTKYLERRSPEGLYLFEEVVPMLRLAYGDVIVQELTPESLEPNDATIAYIQWNDTAHYFIIERRDQLYVEDPQFGASEPYTEYIKRFTNVKYKFYLYSTIRDRGDYLVTREIIDAVLGPPYMGPTDEVLDSIVGGPPPSAADLHESVPFIEPTDDFLDSI